MRIVLDTNVLARAASGPPGPAAELLKLCLESPRELCVSLFLISELSRVLRYDRVRRIHGLSDEGIDEFLQDLQVASVMVATPPEAAMVVASDPDDDPIVATAVAASAQFLCTLDRHLRTPAVVNYCAVHGIEVITDSDLLQRLRSVTE